MVELGEKCKKSTYFSEKLSFEVLFKIKKNKKQEQKTGQKNKKAYKK